MTRTINRLIPIPNKLLLLITITSFIIFIIINKYQQHENAKQDSLDCYTELNKEVKGVVTRAFFDENPDHKGFVIEFTNGKTYRPLFLKKWQPITLDTGDSVYKKAGVFKVFILKKDKEHSFILEDTVNCDSLGVN